MVKIRIQADQVVNHLGSYPNEVPTEMSVLQSLQKVFPDLPRLSSRMGANESFSSHRGSRLADHVLRSASTLLTYKIPNGESKDLDQCHITCDSSKSARLFRVVATSGCRGTNVSSRMVKAR